VVAEGVLAAKAVLCGSRIIQYEFETYRFRLAAVCCGHGFYCKLQAVGAGT